MTSPRLLQDGRLQENDSHKQDERIKKTLHQGLVKFGNEAVFEWFGQLTNMRMAKLNAASMVILALWNVTYTFYAIRITDEHMPQVFWNIQKIILCSAFAEFFVATSYIFLFFWHFWSSRDATQAYKAMESLRSAGSFSILWWLPIPPAKLVYWFTNWDHLTRQVHALPMVRPTQEMRDVSACARRVRRAVEGIGVIMLVMLCLVSFPAAVTKMLMLGNPFRHETRGKYAWYAWYQAFGVLNQMAKMWVPKQIEIAGLHRFANALKEEDNSTEGVQTGNSKGGSDILMELFFESTYKAYDNTFERLAFIGYLDIGTIGRVFRFANVNLQEVLDRKVDP